MISLPFCHHIFPLFAYIFCLLGSTLQPLSHNWPGDNREELFKPGTIVDIVAADDRILVSGIEPCLFAFNVPASGIVIIGPGSFTFSPSSVDLLLSLNR